MQRLRGEVERLNARLRLRQTSTSGRTGANRTTRSNLSGCSLLAYALLWIFVPSE